MQSQEKIGKIFFINLLFLGFLLTLFELFLGTWFRGFGKIPNLISKNGVKVDRSSLNKIWGISSRLPDDDFTTTFKSPQINTKNICRILLMGGSTTIEKELKKEETWSYKLWGNLNNFPEENCQGGYEVINAGVDGNTIRMNNYDLKFRLSRLNKKIDSVILYQGINDMEFITLINKSTNKFQKLKNDINTIINLNSSIFEIKSNLSNLIKGRYKFSEKIDLYKLNKLEISNPKVNSFLLNKENQKKLKNLPFNIDHLNYIISFARKVKKLGAKKIIFITQTYPSCEFINDDQFRIKFLSFEKLPEIKFFQNQENDFSKANLNQLKNSSQGNCLRLKLIRDNYVKAFNIIEKELGLDAHLLDYAYKSKLSQDKISYDFYHTDPRTSSILFNDFVDLGLIDKLRN